jgi:hypothetical protein
VLYKSIDRRKALSEAWRKRKEHEFPDYQRHKNLWRKYKIRPATYDIMLKAQGGVCAICGQEPGEGKYLVVDHCHASGKNRGLLCNRCNIGLGGFRDTVAFMYAAIRYIEFHHGGVNGDDD